jgi:hypothetical protein
LGEDDGEDSENEPDAVEYQQDDDCGAGEGVICGADGGCPDAHRDKDRDPGGADDQLAAPCASQRRGGEADQESGSAEFCSVNLWAI